VRDRLTAAAYRAASRVLVVYRFVRRPTIHGVRCVLLRGDDVLMVRHTYGDRRWSFPGGRGRGGEPPEETARREMREELRLDIDGWRVCGELAFTGDDRATHDVICLVADCPEEPDPNLGEIAELRWFPRHDLPSPTLDHTDTLLEYALTERNGSAPTT
jgi:8-oxo-dGTP pyrophosphatase MutT (NUDIX family)